MGPFSIGDRPVFECPITGTFAKVNVVVLFPDGEVWAYEAHQDTTDTTLWLCSDIMAWEIPGWHAIKWNCYTNVSDILPVRGPELMFLVQDSGSNQDFYYEV